MSLISVGLLHLPVFFSVTVLGAPSILASRIFLALLRILLWHLFVGRPRSVPLRAAGSCQIPQYRRAVVLFHGSRRSLGVPLQIALCPPDLVRQLGHMHFHSLNLCVCPLLDRYYICTQLSTVHCCPPRPHICTADARPSAQNTFVCIIFLFSQCPVVALWPKNVLLALEHRVSRDQPVLAGSSSLV